MLQTASIFVALQGVTPTGKGGFVYRMVETDYHGTPYANASPIEAYIGSEIEDPELIHEMSFKVSTKEKDGRVYCSLFIHLFRVHSPKMKPEPQPIPGAKKFK
jgi:hypothetical protein